MGPKKHCCIGPIPFWLFLPHFTLFSSEILIFQEWLIVETPNQCHWIQHTWNPIYMPLQSILMHFSQSKSTKCEFFGCSLNFSWTNIKKNKFKERKKCCKGLTISTYRFLGVLFAMHYLRTLCDKYFLSYDGLSWLLRARFRHMDSEMWCMGRIGPKKYSCIGPILFWLFYPILHSFYCQIWIYQKLLIVGTPNQCHWIQHTWNTIYLPLSLFWCNFPSQNQQNVKYWQFA